MEPTTAHCDQEIQQLLPSQLRLIVPTEPENPSLGLPKGNSANPVVMPSLAPEARLVLSSRSQVPMFSLGLNDQFGP